MPERGKHYLPAIEKHQPVEMSTASKSGSKKQQMTQEQIIAGFNQLRQEQRVLGSRIIELESDASEHG